MAQRLKERTAELGLEHHRLNPVRVYERDPTQWIRVTKTRRFIERAVRESPMGKVVELGCGTGDLTGQVSFVRKVTGLDCHEASVREARRRFPEGDWLVGNVVEYTPEECAVVVLCEVLEHLENPEELVKLWLPVAQESVISHPIDGDLQGDLSGGDHCWSFGESDLERWFALGGHEMVEREIFSMGQYRIGVARGRRRVNAPTAA